MDQKEFEKYYMCRPWDRSEKECELSEIAKFYHDTCEIFDRVNCSGFNYDLGISMPVTSEEFCKINKHAHSVKKECYEWGRARGFSKDAIARAISEFRY